jgi:AcrR family transcriptional regulator
MSSANQPSVMRPDRTVWIPMPSRCARAPDAKPAPRHRGTIPPRNAEATRQRLIAAARTEFAEHGLAGARVDRIAATAQANKAQIYHYFGSNAQLFDAVWEDLVTQIVEAAPIDVEDLPGFAEGLSDTYDRHPELVGSITWQRLERGHTHAYAIQGTRGRADAIAKAQAAGLVSTRFDAQVLFALIIHVAAFWDMTSPDVHAVVGAADRCTEARDRAIGHRRSPGLVPRLQPVHATGDSLKPEGSPREPDP